MMSDRRIGRLHSLPQFVQRLPRLLLRLLPTPPLFPHLVDGLFHPPQPSAHLIELRLQRGLGLNRQGLRLSRWLIHSVHQRLIERTAWRQRHDQNRYSGHSD